MEEEKGKENAKTGLMSVEPHANCSNKEEQNEYSGKGGSSTTKHDKSFTSDFELVRSFKLLKTISRHSNTVYSIDCSTFNGSQLLCSGSSDKTVCVWDVKTNKLVQSFNRHSYLVYCVKFSQYHYHTHNRSVVCSSSQDNTIRFWDFKNNIQFQMFNGHKHGVCGIEFSSFNGGRYLCSGSIDTTICLWDVETSKSLHVFNGHKLGVRCVDISPLQSNNNNDNNNNNKSNHIGVIGGNGYTICSGSFDKTIRIWDIETTKQLNVFKGHENSVYCIKYGSNESRIAGGANTILSGSQDKSARLWDIRSGQQIQAFKGHSNEVWAVEYTPFVVNNSEIGGNGNVICSGSWDNRIRFWDIRSNKMLLHVIKGNEKEDNGISCLTFLELKKKESEHSRNDTNSLNLFYGSSKGFIRIWGII
ncbi:G-protein beta WD-40 repeats containing protein [Reticulomyxa filosa]|uniref:G-protein beta WD-40 repeats containing protein n=1 Tax=Reticulomyxa filosa TaxID=46433 RepID=X6NDQ9_RETFI|nr:G-protein beta WD-40 repeats containing protein [Reticulomyxa filosa]|eukprot:ETO24450.1 G-protein beta WD-40 repeats containing protein [Reticulomyxa filosa]